MAQDKFHYSPPSADKNLRLIDDSSEYVSDALEAAKRQAGENIDSGGILSTKYEQVFLVSSEGPEGRDGCRVAFQVI